MLVGGTLKDIAADRAEDAVCANDDLEVINSTVLKGDLKTAFFLFDFSELLVRVQNLARQRSKELAEKRGAVDNYALVLAPAEVDDNGARVFSGSLNRC